MMKSRKDQRTRPLQPRGEVLRPILERRNGLSGFALRLRVVAVGAAILLTDNHVDATSSRTSSRTSLHGQEQGLASTSVGSSFSTSAAASEKVIEGAHEAGASDEFLQDTRKHQELHLPQEESASTSGRVTTTSRLRSERAASTSSSSGTSSGEKTSPTAVVEVDHEGHHISKKSTSEKSSAISGQEAPDETSKKRGMKAEEAQEALAALSSEAQKYLHRESRVLQKHSKANRGPNDDLHDEEEQKEEAELLLIVVGGICFLVVSVGYLVFCDAMGGGLCSRKD
ncbi:unnamed protein product [Amoebophrya sp. A25]|nr:unnamed protein product [Amoebophrya sp. A25]|eukprot:GSA25T00008994001.1